jgi:thymidylate kinase
VIVFALIGPCGTGKTTILQYISGKIRTHKEGYVQKDSEVFIDNATYLSKLRYLSSWYLEIIKIKKARIRKVVSDRCPYDVCAYVDDQAIQHTMVQKYMGELEHHFGIKVRTLYLSVPFPIARKRVAERLAQQPWRKQYHEDDDRFLKKTYDYYEDHISEWNHVISNDRHIEESVRELRGIVGGK